MRKSQNYGDAAFLETQPRLTDLVPRRLSVYALWAAVGLAIIAGLEALYAWMPQLASMATDGRVAAFDLDSEGSLGTWFHTMSLALAGCTALLVYSVRRHRSDDYQGHYRIWLWAAGCWWLMSIDEGGSLHEGFKEMMFHLTGARLLGDGSIWWAVPYFFLLAAVGTRLLADMRECRLSATLLVSAACCYATAISGQLDWLLPDAGAKEVMIEEGAELCGGLALVLAMALHARHVILDAEGLLPRRKRAVRVSSDDEDAEDDLEGGEEARPLTIHPPHGIPRPVAAGLAAPSVQPMAGSLNSASQAPKSATTNVGSAQARPAGLSSAGAALLNAMSSTPASSSQGSSGSRKMTKAERKRLRRLKAEREKRLEGG